MKLLVFGAGYSGQAIARELVGEAAEIHGTTRDASKLDALRNAGLEPHVFAGRGADLDAMPLDRITHMVVSIAPDEAGDPVLNAFDGALARRMPALQWIGYLSTTGVYGDHDGAWVSEDTPATPQSRRSVARLAAEDAWQAAGREAGVAVAVLRLSGIYGPGRNALVSVAEGVARRIVKPGQVFNRIHVDDIAGAAAHLARSGIGGIHNLADEEPAPSQDLIVNAAQLMGVAPPPEIPFDTADLSAMARSFYAENKRVSNARLKATGYVLRWPDYRTALETMWRAGTWR